MSEDKKVEDKTPQVLAMLNGINHSLGTIQKNLLALEKHGHIHPGDLTQQAQALGNVNVMIAQITAYFNRQQPANQAVEIGELPTRSTLIAGATKDMAQELTKYVQGVDKQRQALEEHETMEPHERAKKYQEVIVNFFDPTVRPRSKGVLKPGWGGLELREFDLLDGFKKEDYKDHMTPAFYTRTPDGEPEMLMLITEDGMRYVINFTPVEQYFEFGHFYVLWPSPELKYIEFSTSVAPSIQLQIYPKILDALKSLVEKGLNQTA